MNYEDKNQTDDEGFQRTDEKRGRSADDILWQRMVYRNMKV